MPRSKNERLARTQDERNRRILPVRGKERDKLKQKACSLFACHPCRREVVISWKKLGEAPRCRGCGHLLMLVAACLNKGVLPRTR